jgi:hypothetical protein
MHSVSLTQTYNILVNDHVGAKTKESTRKTEEERDGRNKEGHERKEQKRRPVGI